MDKNIIHTTDCRKGLKTLPDNSVDCCITSPPYYGLRDYGKADQIGLELTPEEYINHLVGVFTEVHRVLKPTGTLWLNIGDSYAGSGKGAWKNKEAQKEIYIPNPTDALAKMPKTWDGIKAKDLIGIPWMLAFALRRNGWYLRQEIIWHKPNAMPESVKDRCGKSHETIFLLSKSPNYYFDYKAIQQEGEVRERKEVIGGRNPYYAGSNREFEYTGVVNKRSVWTVPVKPFIGAHFATFPDTLIVDCVKAGCPAGGLVLDPFMGSGTTAVVARKLDRNYIGFELNPEYVEISNKRIANELGFFQ